MFESVAADLPVSKGRMFSFWDSIKAKSVTGVGGVDDRGGAIEGVLGIMPASVAAAMISVVVDVDVVDEVI
jgi:hypothetical protein